MYLLILNYSILLVWLQINKVKVLGQTIWPILIVRRAEPKTQTFFNRLENNFLCHILLLLAIFFCKFFAAKFDWKNNFYFFVFFDSYFRKFFAAKFDWKNNFYFFVFFDSQPISFCSRPFFHSMTNSFVAFGFHYHVRKKRSYLIFFTLPILPNVNLEIELISLLFESYVPFRKKVNDKNGVFRVHAPWSKMICFEKNCHSYCFLAL